MRKTKANNNGAALLVSTDGLMETTNAGRRTAVEIGTAAGARVQVGRRVLWNIEKVRAYLNAISE